MFLLKKIISRLFFPIPLSLELLGAGLFLLWFTRRQRAGKTLVTAGTLLLLALSNTFVSNALLRPLERAYPPLVVAPGGTGIPAVRYIAVLGGWANEDPSVPVSSHICPDLMVRLIEGVRLHRQISGSKLILSGGHDSADGMAKMAEALGVAAGDTMPLAEPLDTEEESRQIAPIVGGQPFILVTSAAHMPRAVALCRKRGLHPIPAPTDHLAPEHRTEFDDLVPDGYKLFKSRIAFYEYFGRVWARLRGEI
jgi:uncharacterized SAM-binding protein YcdF (DUF218 family)